MPQSADLNAGTPGHWGCCCLRADGTVEAYVAAHSTAHADRQIISLPTDEALAVTDEDAICVVWFDEHGRPRTIEVRPHVVPKAPPLWFLELPEPDAQPPAICLLAFEGHGVEPGTLVDEAALSELPVTSPDQLGATRWYPATGELDQVYVAPRARGRQVATALIVAASTLQVARTGVHVWSDGQRTAHGERLLKANPSWVPRAAPLTHLAPPMTPFDQR